MESKCPITPICGVTCDKCPAFNRNSRPTGCEVMDVAIRAFHAQEDYWKCKLEIERKEILSQVDDIAARLDSVEGKIKDIMRNSEQGKSG